MTDEIYCTLFLNDCMRASYLMHVPMLASPRMAVLIPILEKVPHESRVSWGRSRVTKELFRSGDYGSPFSRSLRKTEKKNMFLDSTVRTNIC